nr:MAG TPA: hypothetical protein [Caudoviricetes sp.]
MTGGIMPLPREVLRRSASLVLPLCALSLVRLST